MTYDQLPIWSSDVIGMWIGLNDCNSNRKYTWQDSYELVITNWAKGQPSEHGVSQYLAGQLSAYNNELG